MIDVVEPGDHADVVAQPPVVVERNRGRAVVAAGPPRGSGSVQNLYVQPNDPGLTIPGMWLQTGLGVGGQDFTLWFEDGT